MAFSSRGSPPAQHSLESPIVQDIQTRSAGLATRPQLVDAANKVKGNKIIDLPSARQYLETSQLVSKDAHFTRTELFTTLMKLSLLPQASLAKLGNTLRALAYLGEEIDDAVAQEVADMTAQAVSEAISPLVEDLVTSHRDLRKSVQGIAGECSSVLEAVEESRGEVRALEAQLKEMKEAAGAASVATAAAVAEVQAATKAVPVGPRS
ncbi:hypothetical protein DFH06DRAFT_1330252 [Mycena polygramma]|nr:hypothetical protein DFH06DRAFT_1330252 [Mycena polygramma]